MRKVNEKLNEKDFVEAIEKILYSDIPENKWFKMKVLFNGHVSLYQDFNSFGLGFVLINSTDDEYNSIAGITIFFWSIEISWEWRKKNGKTQSSSQTI